MEKDDRARPFFVEENDFGDVGDGFYDADKNNFSPRLSAAYQISDRDRAAGRLRALLRSRPVRGPHPADRELHRPQPRPGLGRARQHAGLPGGSRDHSQPAVDSRLHPRLPERVQHAVRRQRLAGAAGRLQPDGRLHGQQGLRHVPARRRQRARPGHARPAGAKLRADRLQDRGLRRRRRPGGIYPTAGCGRASYDALQISAHAALPCRLHRRAAVPGTRLNKGTTQGSNEAGRRRTRSTSRPSTAPTRRTSRTPSTARSST